MRRRRMSYGRRRRMMSRGRRYKGGRSYRISRGGIRL